MVCSILKFGMGHNFQFSGKYFCQKQAEFELTRNLKGLSLNFYKIRLTELKLWPFKYALFNAFTKLHVLAVTTLVMVSGEWLVGSVWSSGLRPCILPRLSESL